MKMIKTFGIILLTLMSCSKNNDQSYSNMEGVFTETFPHNGRSQLIFPGGNIIIRAEAGSDVQDSYKYKIIQDKIILIPTWNETLTTEFQFVPINNTKFLIENIFPDIPENLPSYMTFEKQ